MTEDRTDNPYYLDLANVNWQPGNIPFANGYEDIYFSPSEGLAETTYVFLQHNQLATRWQALPCIQGTTESFTIGETGFGTGLNFLAAWRLWREISPSGWTLHFISTEKHPLSRADLQRALSAWPELAEQSTELLSNYPVLVPGQHTLSFDNGSVILQLFLGDATTSLEQLCATHRAELPLTNHWQVDAWFLDGFAPAKNPSLWSDALFQHIARLSGPGTTVATFTAVGDVRRGLMRHGFKMQKTKGFGNKREMLCGQFNERPSFSATASKGIKAPWYYSPPPPAKPTQIAIIGAGLAGAHTAHALARRGFKVDLVDSGEAVASGASGNPQGMLYTKLSPQAGTLNQFTLASYLFALRLYRNLNMSAHEAKALCGVLQLANTEKEQRLLAELQTTFAHLPELVRFMDAGAASRQAGIYLNHAGSFFPGAGWIAPAELCNTLTAHPAINVHLNTPVSALSLSTATWQLLDASGQTIIEADAVVIANSHRARQFVQCEHLPLKTIRGQITQLPANAASEQLQTVLCHEGYLTPAIHGHHHLGATFDLHDDSLELREQDHQRNLDSLSATLPDLFDQPVDIQSLSGRAGIRCASPDYLPLVGPVADITGTIERYQALAKNAHWRIDSPGSYYPGLYLNVAHGSRGLTSTPLCAELLASQINCEPPPLSRSIREALNPSRFLIRDLIRNKIHSKVLS